MTYIVNDNCIRCKYTDCVEVCPVDCFYEGENMLVIDPDECIDCGVCEPECPAEAILPDTDPGAESWLKLNADMAQKWPNITRMIEAPADADEFKGVSGKFEKYFSDKPGEGNQAKAIKHLIASCFTQLRPIKSEGKVRGVAFSSIFMYNKDIMPV